MTFIWHLTFSCRLLIYATCFFGSNFTKNKFVPMRRFLLFWGNNYTTVRSKIENFVTPDFLIKLNHKIASIKPPPRTLGTYQIQPWLSDVGRGISLMEHTVRATPDLSILDVLRQRFSMQICVESVAVFHLPYFCTGVFLDRMKKGDIVFVRRMSGYKCAPHVRFNYAAKTNKGIIATNNTKSSAVRSLL